MVDIYEIARIFNVCVFIAFTSVGIVTVGYYYYMNGLHKVPFESVSLDSTEFVGEVGCMSNSMGLTLNCHDLLYEDEVNYGDRLYPGVVYVYTMPNKSVVHRLVYCIDSDCNQSVFKGDNNEVGELVNRSQILYRVMKVEYK